MPFRFDWHQGSGKQNREIETTPWPRQLVHEVQAAFSIPVGLS
jgi:hypothetical protein